MCIMSRASILNHHYHLYRYFINQRNASFISLPIFLQLAEAVRKILYAADAKESALVDAQEFISRSMNAGREVEYELE